MTQPDLNITTALEAIAEGMNILQLLACATDKTQWIDDSVPLSKLNELAQSLGYRDAQSVHSQVESDKDMDECYAKIRQLRTGLVQCRTELAAVGAALDVEKSAHRGSVLIADDVVNEIRQEVKQLQTDLKFNARALAELRAERQLRQKAEWSDDASRLVIDGAHEALDECQIKRSYDDGKPASARTRIFWLSQRAETLAQLVNEETAELLEKMATENVTVYEECKVIDLVAQIREALIDEH